MSFCSYEEAWGAPYNQNQEKNDHVTKNDNITHNEIKNTTNLLSGALFRPARRTPEQAAEICNKNVQW